MATLSPLESAYLTSEPRLGRLATVDADGQPHVVPVGWRYDEPTGTFTISGRGLAATRKFRNVAAHPRAALVIDDVLPPWRARGVLVQGTARAVSAADAEDGRAVIQLAPAKVISWGLDGDSR
jgi:pyridoxamine 5'-phosphate oxidase family protein